MPERSTSTPTVGVVGLGAMGGPIARHLVAAGLPVHVVEPDDEAVGHCPGTERHATPAAMASVVDVVLVLVPDDGDVLAVCTAGDGILAAAAPGTVVLLCSSLQPQTCEQVAAAAPPGVTVLDAALTGGVRGVEAGEVNLLVGGDADALARVRLALEPWCSHIHHLGRLGSGQVAKTANNLIHWAQISAIAEAFGLAASWGVSVPALRRALQAGPTDSRTMRELELMRLTWHVKDMANAQRLARSLGTQLPVAEAVRRSMLDTTVDGLAELLQSPGGPDPNRYLEMVSPTDQSGVSLPG
jgi:3-hydroxyisobutyrate dehydrogenase-like beta-hydroxyacid dehydrogenase